MRPKATIGSSTIRAWLVLEKVAHEPAWPRCTPHPPYVPSPSASWSWSSSIPSRTVLRNLVCPDYGGGLGTAGFVWPLRLRLRGAGRAAQHRPTQPVRSPGPSPALLSRRPTLGGSRPAWHRLVGDRSKRHSPDNDFAAAPYLFDDHPPVLDWSGRWFPSPAALQFPEVHHIARSLVRQGSNGPIE